MPLCPFARQYNPRPSHTGLYPEDYDGPVKVVWHKTQGSTAAGAFAAYVAKGGTPHFTLDWDGTLYQHIDTRWASYSLWNEPGGVNTNTEDLVIQIEVVGFVNENMTAAQRDRCLQLRAWLKATHGVPDVWPAGRPIHPYPDSYGEDNGNRPVAVWDTRAGHFGHSQVPENDHGDPAWTDWEWAFMSFASAPEPPTPQEPPLVSVRTLTPIPRPRTVQLDGAAYDVLDFPNLAPPEGTKPGLGAVRLFVARVNVDYTDAAFNVVIWTPQGRRTDATGTKAVQWETVTFKPAEWKGYAGGKVSVLADSRRFGRAPYGAPDAEGDFPTYVADLAIYAEQLIEG